MKLDKSPPQSPPRMRRNFSISGELNEMLNHLAKQDNRSASNMLEKMILEEWAGNAKQNSRLRIKT